MKIAILDWKSFGLEDICEAFIQLGHDTCMCPYFDELESTDGGEREQGTERIKKWLRKEVPDAFFSFNYYPTIADACRQESLPYLAWVYDSPFVKLYDPSIIYPTNHVFVFDSVVYREFQSGRISTVQFLPMAAHVERLDRLQADSAFRNSLLYPKHEIAFVGSLYAEQHCFFERLTGIAEYTRGYLEGLIQTQQLVYGSNFIQSSLTDTVLKDMQQSLPLQVRGVESLEYLFAQYVINREITKRERPALLSMLGKKFGVDIYTPMGATLIDGCVNHGLAEAYNQAPLIYKTAAINLNITLRSIASGIPLRAFEIMGSGGFLLTNFQEDFLSFFVPDEDYVYFESKEDLVDRTDYYLKHEDERRQIAANGKAKVAAAHTYLHRAQEMLSYLC